MKTEEKNILQLSLSANGGKQLDEQRRSVEFALPSWRNLAKLQTKFPALIGSFVSSLLT